MKNSRALAILLLALTLTACGDDDNDDAAEATTQACRSYVLVGGADDKLISDELQGLLDDTGGVNVESTSARLAAIRAAAAKGGLVEDLPTKDYRLFAAVVESSYRAADALEKAEVDLAEAAAEIGAYQRAVTALHERCD